MSPLSENTPTFELGSTEGPCKGSLAWAAALLSPSIVISDGNGKLVFRNKLPVAECHSVRLPMATGELYSISMDEFELEEEIGRGHFGLVLLVRHRLSGRLMALKDIRLEISEQFIKRLMTELDVLTRASSPYIIEFFGACHNEASVYLCLEYMDAGSLEHLYKTHGPVPEPVLAAVAYCVVMGMNFLHKELHMMHRDVKPSNILLNRQGGVKLCDFGISGYLVRSLARTHIGSMCYIAPERITVEKPVEYTAKADIWSLGVSLFEAATCETLYSEEKFDSPFAQLMALVKDPSPQLSEEVFSPACRSFVDACLQKDPNHRASFGQLLGHEWIAHFRDEGAPPAKLIISQWLQDKISMPKT